MANRRYVPARKRAQPVQSSLFKGVKKHLRHEMCSGFGPLVKICLKPIEC